MNTDLNFNNLINSDFYRKASYCYKYEKSTKEVWKIKKQICILSANILNVDSILDIPISQTYEKIFPDLYYLLYSSELDEVFRKLIINQWLEVIKHTQMQMIFPSMSYLILFQSPDSMPSHKHLEFSKQTVSFIYNYNFSETSSSYIMVNGVEFKIPPKEKIILNMHDNPWHSAYIHEGFWFIWVNEYKEHFRIKDETLKIFHLLE